MIGAGMGLPGPIDRETGVVGSSADPARLDRRSTPAAEMERAPRRCRVHVDNDANLGALAESAFGAGRGRHATWST